MISPYRCVEGGGVADYCGDGAAAAALDEDDDNDDDDKFSLGRAVGIVVAQCVGGPGDVGSMPNMGRYLSFLRTVRTGCGSPTASCHTDTVVNDRGMNLISDLHLFPRLRIPGGYLYSPYISYYGA